MIKHRICPVRFHDLELKESEIETYLGIRREEGTPSATSFFREQTAVLLQELETLSGFQFGYMHVEGVICDKESIRLNGRSFHPGNIITRCFQESESFIILLATIGPEMDQWLHNKQTGGDLVEAFIADALGSVVVEAIVAHAMSVLEQEESIRQFRISNSYSPGYCGWNVAEQQELFALLPPLFCGVRLTESSLMLPVKSVSALIGTGRTLVRKPYGCAICRKKDCFKRNAARP